MIASLGLGCVALGMTGPLIALNLERAGAGALVIGLNAAMPSAALFAIAPLLPRIAARLGALATIYLGLAAWGAATLAMAAFTGIGAWFALRFLLGLGVAAHWVVGEVWISSVAAEGARGRIAGAYVGVTALGFALGPLALESTGIDGPLPFAVAAGAVALAALALVPAWGAMPVVPPPARTLGKALTMGAVIMALALAAGFCDGAAVSLLPIYVLERGYSREGALLLLALFLAGNAVVQAPLGWLADRFDWRLLVAGSAAVALAATALLPAAAGRPAPLAALLFVWGGAELGLYTLGLARLGARFPADALVPASAAFALMYGLGSLVGPVVAGGAMDALGPEGLPLSVGLAILALIAVGAARRRGDRGPRRTPPPRG